MKPAALPLPMAAVVVLLAIAACGEAPPARSGADAAKPGGEASAGAQRSVALLFEAKKPGSKPFPFSFVEVTIADQSTRFLVDTFARTHVIDGAVMKRAQLSDTVRAS